MRGDVTMLTAVCSCVSLLIRSMACLVSRPPCKGVQMGLFKRCIRFLPMIVFISLSAHAGLFHVPAAASPGGTGSPGNPWQLQAALQSSSVKPGDTIWVHG